MSLDVYLILKGAQKSLDGSGIFVRENGQAKEISWAEWDERFPGREPVIFVTPSEEDGQVFEANITHNLAEMASEAGLYKYLWRPEEVEAYRARDIIPRLTNGLIELKKHPEYYKSFNPTNKWGRYEDLVAFVEQYLAACEKYPEARIEVSR